MDVENENSELSKSTEEEIHVYDDRDAFIKESCEDELELGLTVSFCDEQETREVVNLMMAIKTIKNITSVLLKMEAIQQVKNLTGYFSLIRFQFIFKNGRRREELDINGMVRSEA